MARLGLSWETISHLLHLPFPHRSRRGVGSSPLRPQAWPRPAPGTHPLALIGPSGARRSSGSSCAVPTGPTSSDPGFPLEVHELSPGDEWVDPKGGSMRFGPARPTTPKIPWPSGWRTETVLVGYTGDTGPDTGARHLLSGMSASTGGVQPPRWPRNGDPSDPKRLWPPWRQGRPPDLLVAVHCYPPLDPETVPVLLAAQGYRRQGPHRLGRTGYRFDGRSSEGSRRPRPLAFSPDPGDGAVRRDLTS